MRRRRPLRAEDVAPWRLARDNVSKQYRNVTAMLRDFDHCRMVGERVTAEAWNGTTWEAQFRTW